MRTILLSLLLTTGMVYGEDLDAEDKEIIKELEFFSNMELMEEDLSFEEIEDLGEDDLASKKQGQQS